MPLTVAALLSMPGLDELQVLAGRRHLTERTITWAHVIELADPTPWLQGGELVLTTGLGLGPDEESQRDYVRRLAGADAAALGFGTGLSFAAVPPAVCAQADELGLPLFEVPRPVPFLAVTKAVAGRLAAEQYETVQRAVEAQRRLTRAAGRTRQLDHRIEPQLGGQCERLTDVPDEPTRHPGSGQRSDPGLRRAADQRSFECRPQVVAVGNPAGVRRKAWVDSKLRDFEHRAQSPELGVGADCDDQWTISGGQGLVRCDVRVTVSHRGRRDAGTQIIGRLVHQPGQQRGQQVDLDALAAPAAGAFV